MMKHMKKKTIAMVLAALAAMTSLDRVQRRADGIVRHGRPARTGTYTIGVVQYATHPSPGQLL